MEKEDLLKKIKESLEKMGCTEITFLETPDGVITATFNCKEITSFVESIPGWMYSGIHLDPTHSKQYKIDFWATIQ